MFEAETPEKDEELRDSLVNWIKTPDKNGD